MSEETYKMNEQEITEYVQGLIKSGGAKLPVEEQNLYFKFFTYQQKLEGTAASLQKMQNNLAQLNNAIQQATAQLQVTSGQADAMMSLLVDAETIRRITLAKNPQPTKDTPACQC
jgi:hypothetical protein